MVVCVLPRGAAAVRALATALLPRFDNRKTPLYGIRKEGQGRGTNPIAMSSAPHREAHAAHAVAGLSDKFVESSACSRRGERS